MLRKILSIICSILFYVSYGFTLIIMHFVQWLCYHLGGYSWHHNSVYVLNKLLLATTYLLGTSYQYIGKEKIPKGSPLIFVSNHQSMFDVSPLEASLSSFHPKFIAKKELGIGIPSVSYNLRKGGSVLIDRNNPKKAINEIKKLAQLIQAKNYAAIIFPEGTRSKDGYSKPFKESGLKVLTKYAKNAYIIPVTINNSWKVFRTGVFPLHLGVKITLEYKDPIKVSDYTFEELFKLTEQQVKNSIHQ